MAKHDCTPMALYKAAREQHLAKLKTETDIAREGLLKAANPKTVIYDTPNWQNITSESVETRKATHDLVESTVSLKASREGDFAPNKPVQAVMRESKYGLGMGHKGLDDSYKEYSRAWAKLSPEEKLNSPKKNKVDYKREVAKAMRRGDEHPDANIARAAKNYRDQVVEPLHQKAIKLGVMEKGEVTTAKSYFPRVYNLDVIAARRGELKDIFYKWLREKEALKPLEDQRSEVTLDKVADRIIDRIEGTPGGRLPYDGDEGTVKKTGGRGSETGGVSSPLKPRLLEIPDERIEDFLDSDVEHVLNVYERSMASDLAIIERFGDIDMTKAKDAIAKEYAEMRNNPDISVAKKKRLAELEKRDINNLLAMRDRLRGTFGMNAQRFNVDPRVTGALKAWNYVTAMGSVMLSSISDLGGAVMKHGMVRVMRDGLVPLASNLKATKLAIEDVKRSGVAWDLMLDSRIHNIAEVMDDYGRGTPTERAIRAATSTFTNMTLMPHWNQGLRQFSGLVTQARALDTAVAFKNGKKVSKKDMARLRDGYINNDMAVKVAKQFEQHGVTERGLKIPNTHKWTDDEARRAFHGMIARDVDRIIVNPGEDKPLWMSDSVLGLIGQFKSFFIASHQRVLLSGLQDTDLATLSGVTTMVGLGVISTLLRDKLAGRETNTDPAALIAEGVDRSGILGYAFEINNALEKFSRGQWGLSAMIGKEPMTRYQSRNLWDAMLGPTLGKAKDVQSVGGALITGDWSAGDVKAARRLIPLQTLFYLRVLFDTAQNNIIEQLGE